jgi:hypothetical protein
MRHFLLPFALLLPLSAQETMIREVFDPKTDTHVEVLALFTQPSRGGFFPVRVKVANNLANERSIRLDFRSYANYDGRIQSKSSFPINAPAGKTVTRDIMVPLCDNPAPHGDSLNFSVELSGSLGRAENTIHTNTGTNSPSVLLSESLFTPNASALDAECMKTSGSRYGSHSFAAKFDPKQLPGDWLAFSGYDSVMMTESDWSNVPAGARAAIFSWVNLGGQLVIYGGTNPGAASLGLPENAGFGSCVIRPVSSDLKLDPKETVGLAASNNPVRHRHAAISSDYGGSWPLQARFGSQGFHYGVFIAVLIVFGILVGPVNLFVFAKSGRRHRLFITTPLISLGASLVLIALIIFQDGFGGNGMRRILMEVRPDSGRNAAFLHQEQFSRTGILTGARFTVDPACLFVPVPIARSRWARHTNDYNTRGVFNLQPGGGKMEASGDWWQSRSEHGHALTAVISTRGRIERGGDSKTFVSTFDFPIETLYVLDESKQWHRAESIATGTPFTLTPVDSTMAEPALAEEANAFTTRNQQLFSSAKNRPNHFIAITGAAPGIDTHPGIRWKETRTIITGPVTGKN